MPPCDFLPFFIVLRLDRLTSGLFLPPSAPAVRSQDFFLLFLELQIVRFSFLFSFRACISSYFQFPFVAKGFFLPCNGAPPPSLFFSPIGMQFLIFSCPLPHVATRVIVSFSHFFQSASVFFSLVPRETSQPFAFLKFVRRLWVFSVPLLFFLLFPGGYGFLYLPPAPRCGRFFYSPPPRNSWPPT